MRFFILFVAFIYSTFLAAQVPGLVPYQAVALNASGQILANTSTSARFKLHEFSTSGSVVWTEDQSVLTNANGLFTAQLGAISSMEAIDWSQGNLYLQVEILVGGIYVDQGTKQLLSVPYAKYAGSIKLDVSSTGTTKMLSMEQFPTSTAMFTKPSMLMEESGWRRILTWGISKTEMRFSLLRIMWDGIH